MIFADSVSHPKQVLINILENALRYTPEGSPLEISAEISPFAVEVFVADRGPGIPKEKEAKLFEGNSTGFIRRAPESGVGLGLAICRAIIEVHGCTIQAQNRASGGCYFLFMIPVDRQPPAMEAEE